VNAKSVGLAIFVKTPSLSPVKTRLWPRLGRRRAEAFHLASAAAVASVVQEARAESGTALQLLPHWAIAEHAALHGASWRDFAQLPQGDGGLGERMDRVHALLLQRSGGALLLGADTPQLSSASLHRASNWLAADAPRIVIGRAQDGGFWLFGSNCPIPAHCWTAVAYSTSNTARDFLAQVAPFGECVELEELSDVDHFEDFEAALEQLAALPQRTAAQQCLLLWMQDVLKNQDAAIEEHRSMVAPT
jgi:glycosyltransferase A (GT-A) superfamily protein (DUF2064 family)